MTTERNPERTNQRISSSHRGGQYFPKELMDENYHYRWVNYESNKMWKAIETERLGYEPVLATDTNSFQSKVLPKDSMVKEGFVVCPLRAGGQAVLMRIPRALYEQRKKEDHAIEQAAYKTALQNEIELDGKKSPHVFTFN